jgi:hypothetical protein
MRDYLCIWLTMVNNVIGWNVRIQSEDGDFPLEMIGKSHTLHVETST